MSVVARNPARPDPVRWYLAALVLVLFDGWASAMVIEEPSGEANPLLAALMGRVGVGPALTLRVLFGAALLTTLLALAERHWQAREALATAALVHAAVAAWHLLGPLAL